MKLGERAIGLLVMGLVLAITLVVLLPIGGRPIMPKPAPHELVPMIVGVPISGGPPIWLCQPSPFVMCPM